MPRVPALLLLLAAASGAACALGKIEESAVDEAHGLPPGGPDTGPDPTNPDGGPPLPPFSPASASIKRLSATQYKNAIRDLFGAGIKIPTDLEVETKLHGFTSIGASELTISPRAAEQFEAAARDVSKQVFGDDARRKALVGCTPTKADEACVRTFLASFGRRAWRRPLEASELDRWQGVATKVAADLSSVWVGIEHAVSGMLQSPYFLFRVELGVDDVEKPGRKVYDDWEMASRLSFFLWNAQPDDELLDAASRKELTTAAGLRAQADRMVASDKAREALRGYFIEYLNLDRLDAVTKDAKLFPMWNASLAQVMRGEVVRAFEDITFDRDVDFREVFVTRQTWVDPELAKIYGITPPSVPGFSKVTLPESGPRAGLLGMAAILTLYSHATITSPTLRGRFVRANLLCQEIPPPPPGVVTSLDDEGGSGPKTTREKLTKHRTNATCAACHSLMDPIGLGMEDFDAIGAHRTTELDKPLDASGDLDGTTFIGAKQLGELIRNDKNIGLCQVRKLYRHATGHMEGEGEEIILVDLARKFEASGYRFKQLLVDVVTSDGFKYAGQEAVKP